MGIVRNFLRGRKLEEIKRGRKAAKKVRFPKGFQGAVMWCPNCYTELRRIPQGEVLETAAQQAIVDLHRSICKAVH